MPDTALTDEFPHPLFLDTSPLELMFERRQLVDEGRVLEPVADEFEAVEALFESEQREAGRRRAADLFDRTRQLPERDDYGYHEPSALDAIRSARPDGPRTLTHDLDEDGLYDRLYGGWLGACCGCLLGKPVQGWSTDRIWGYLEDLDRYPLSDYFRSDVPDAVAERYDIYENFEDVAAFVNDIDHMPRDDDIDYVLVGLGVFREHGPAFTSEHVADYWLKHLELYRTYTAERIAYRNFANLVTPPESAVHRNPYREMIGALIRADFWGYVSTGSPERAAAFAWRDARISHVKNGLYGAMWAAAMVATAPVVSDVERIIRIGLSEVPASSRLHEAVQAVLGWHADGLGYDGAVERIHDRWDEENLYDWVHTLSNAQIIATGLLWSDGRLGRGICRAVQAGFDTDSHAATVGSILGAMNGAQALPPKWTDPIDDTVEATVLDSAPASVSSLAEETVDLHLEHAT